MGGSKLVKVLVLPWRLLTRCLLPAAGLPRSSWSPQPFSAYYSLRPPSDLDPKVALFLRLLHFAFFFPGYLLYLAIFYGLTLGIVVVFYGWCLVKIPIKLALGDEF
ncbi:hypothetical protein AAG570_014091 [Ranatra chinensis]|uniref:Uncharacterized protein n=1 Tax=Ranatra chinensis TaxID=642074 RepID=A0ABD0XS29_9HEMI